MGRRDVRGAGAIAVLLLTGTLALTACSAGDEASQLRTSDAGSASGGGESSADAGSGEAAAPAAGDDAAKQGRGVAPVDVDALAAQRAVVREGSIELRRRDVATARSDVTTVATTAGGWVGDERTRTRDGRVVGTDLVLVVPTDRFSAAMDRVADSGEVVSRRQTAQDVTEQVVDIDSRVRSAEASLQRVRTLLSRADRIGDVIQLEDVLSQRQADLESLKAQQQSLSQRTSTATIRVSVSEPPRGASPAEKDGTGFLAGLSHGWSALAAVWTGAATALGAALPLLLAVGVPLGLVGWVVRRRWIRGVASPGTGQPGAGSAG